jgi:hypothetical protein
LLRLTVDWPRLRPLLDEEQAGAPVALARAVEDLRANRGGQTLSLSEVIGTIAFKHLKEQWPLVVDTLALREAGLGRNTSLTIKSLSADEHAAPWAESRLTLVPLSSAVLLTTDTGRDATMREPLPESIERAIVAAIARGQDSTARYRSVLNWLAPDNVIPAAAVQPRLLGLADEAGESSEWEPAPGLADEALLVVRRDLVTAAGLILTGSLATFFWMIRRCSVRWRLAWLLLALAVSGLGVLWLPVALRDLAWWPLVAGCAGALVWYLTTIVRPSGNPSSEIRNPRQIRNPKTEIRNPATAALGTTVLLLGLLAGWSGRAALPPPVTVYLVRGPADAPENQTVLVPADFLKRLKASARPAPLVAKGPGAVLLDAFYEGKLVDGQAEFTVIFSVHGLNDEANMLYLPFSGVQLFGDTKLDGERAHPLALPAPEAGYSLPIRGRGRHEVELHFRVPVVGDAADRNVLFAIPPLLRSRLSWHVPMGAAHTQCLVKHGAQWTSRDGAGERLDVDLGRLNTPLQLHWHQAPQSAKPARVLYRAAYLWDLHLEGSRLTAWLRYRIRDGAVQTLEVDLPANLEVHSVDVQRATVAEPAPAWMRGIRLRRWHVVTIGSKRTLRMELPYPIAGDFQATLELVPRAPLPAVATLSLPTPRGQRSSRPHYLAYRTYPGLDARRETSQNITRIGENQFAPDWPGVPRLKAKSSGESYEITPDRNPLLRLHLRRSPPLLQAEVQVAVLADRQLAQVEVAADLKAPNKDLGLVEWDLQPPHLIIAAVTGDDVRAWKQTDRRLLVWLTRTTAATRLKLSGWLPMERRDGQTRFELPCPRVLQAGEPHVQLRLAAAPGLSLHPVHTRNLQLVNSPGGNQRSEKNFTFETRQQHYGGSCVVQTAVKAVARVLTLAEFRDRELHFTATVDYTVSQGDLRFVQLRLRNWGVEKVEWQAAKVANHRELRRSPADRSLLLDLRPGVTGRYRVTLRGSVSLEEAEAGTLLPNLTVLGVERPEYVVALSGEGLSGEARGSLTRLDHPAKELSNWPDAARQVEGAGSRAWRVQGDEWELSLLPHVRPAQASPLRVFLTDQSSAVVDGRRWLHEARYWLKHEAHSDLNVTFAAPARVVAVAVDGIETTPLQPEPSRLWLPLPGRAGVRCVRLRWSYDKDEPLEHPNLTPPVLVDALPGPILWTMWTPDGWEPATSKDGARLGTGSTREGTLALFRAEAQLQITRELCQNGRDGANSESLSAAQRRFARHCLHAQHALDVGASRGGAMGPSGQSLAAWLHQLREDNGELARQKGFDDVRVESERLASAGETIEVDVPADEDSGAHFTDPERDPSGSAGLPRRGTPISWQAPAGSAPPTLQFVSREEQWTRQSLIASGQLLGVLAVVWLLSFVPMLLSRLRLIWPEQLVLIGALGWHLSGLTWVVVILLFFALCGRLFLLAQGLRALFRKRPRQPSTMTATNGTGS